MTTVYSNRFPIHPSVKTPDDAAWKQVRSGVDSLRGDMSAELRARLDKAGADKRITRDEYFSPGGAGLVGTPNNSIQGAMREDVHLAGLRVGKVDTFDVTALRAALADTSVSLDPAVRRDMTALVERHDDALRRGEILTGTHVDKQGGIHELTEGRINVDYDTFMARMNPLDWSPNLPRYRGGEVRELSRTQRPDGVLEVHQQERMSLDSFPSNLDMTKNSIVEIGEQGTKVSWHVFHSDPSALTLKTRSVMKDDGYIDFQRTDDGKVLVRSHSVHQVRTPGTQLARFVLGQGLTNELTGQAGLGGFFKEMVQRYRDIGEGRRAAVDTRRPIE
ncbi:MAG: hypothetical protein HY904_20760 [Deltaproteobacteria bacterium]|nr:hypothetical protein [Deltaproteobacteria bacterium]